MKKGVFIAILLCCVVFEGFGQTRAKPVIQRKTKDTALIMANDRKLAQPKVRLSFGFEFGEPLGQASDIYGTVFGGSVKLEVPVAPKFFVTLTGGFTEYAVKLDYRGSLLNLKPAGFVPVELGGRYYFSRLIYVEGDLGASFNTSSYFPTSKTGFVYAPVIGLSAPTSKHKNNIDIDLRYEARSDNNGSIGTMSQLAVRLAYKFGL